jgi:endo-1,4-beta-xylanase
LPPITRREGLAALAGLAATATMPAHAETVSPVLKAEAEEKGRRFGSAFAWSPPGADRGSFANPRYAALLIEYCDLVVPENELKWQRLRPTPTTFNFGPADAMIDWATSHGLAVRGHNLLWNQPKWMPKWEESYDFGARPASEAARLVSTHIRTVIGRYGDRIHGWDVVNETVRPADGALYETAFSRAMGGTEPLLDLAFHTARDAAPGAQLVYNDYMSWEPHNEAHRAGVLRLLEGFRRRGTPVDALGVQSHLVTQGPGGGAAGLEGEWRRFLDQVTAMGYKLLVTELDVRDNNLPADPAVRDVAVAAFTAAYLDIMLSYPQLRDVLCWGLTDRYSWIDGFEPRKDGAPRRPCPFDRDFQPKPMLAAMAHAFRSAKARAA